MRVTCYTTIEVADEAEAKRILAEQVATLPSPPSAQGYRIEDRPFTVMGTVKGSPSKTWAKTIRAEDAGAAAAQITDNNANVVAVFNGNVAPEIGPTPS